MSALKFYLVFTLAFLEMHLIGAGASALPYWLNALLVCTAVMTTLLLYYKYFLAKPYTVALPELGFRKSGFQENAPAIVISIILILAYPVLGFLLNADIKVTEKWLWNLPGLLLTGGLTEEMLFRGFLFGRLRQKMNFRRSTLVSTIVFSSAHLLLFTYLSWPIALLSTILAIGLSWPFAYLFEKAGNTLWGVALVHTSVRTIGMVFTTDDRHYASLALAWIAVSLLIPYLVLLGDKNFRQVFRNNTCATVPNIKI